jgi:hypothetical protein
MKTRSFLLTTLVMSSVQLFAQLPVVGTWELVSMKGTNFAGEPTFVDASMEKVMKIITPTHYMLIAHNVKGDSLIFNRSHAGDVILNGNKYIETLKTASWDGLIPTTCTFYWKVEGDKLIKYGSIACEDGKTATQEMMVFKRVNGATSYPNNPANGTWDQLSSSFTLPDGKQGSHTRETATRFQIFSPTHWFRMHHRDGKFESVMAGPYTMKGKKLFPELEAASFPINKQDKVELNQRVEGDKLYVSGKLVYQNGKIMTWDDVFQKVEAETIK